MDRCRLFVLAAVGLSCSTAALNEDVPTVTNRLAKVTALNNIDDASMTPWHLKLSFQLMDAKGKAAEQGTIEEWWKSPSTYKVAFTSPSYTSTEIHTANGTFRTRGSASSPYLFELVRQQIVHPLTEEDLKNGTPDLRKETLGKVPLDCIMIAQPIKRPAYASLGQLTVTPLGLFPTYCLDRDQDVLRASYNFGNEAVLRNNVGTFQKRMVPVDLIVTSGNSVAITSHIDDLRGASLTEDTFATTVLEPITLADVASGVMAGQAIDRPRPTYPDRAKANHVSGSVRMGARIGTDGRIHSLRLLSVPDADLAIAAVTAVRQWTYKPYLLNGVPVEVQTEITINFNMGN